MSYAFPDEARVTAVYKGSYVGPETTYRFEEFDYRIDVDSKSVSGEPTKDIWYYNSQTGLGSGEVNIQPERDPLYKPTHEYTFTEEEVARIDELAHLYRERKYKMQEETVVKLSATTVAIRKGKKMTLSVLNNSSKVTWKTSNKKIVTVSKKGSIKAVKKGSATITAVVDKVKYKCSVTVIDNYTDDEIKLIQNASNMGYNSVSPDQFVITGLEAGNYVIEGEHAENSMYHDNSFRFKLYLSAKCGDDVVRDYLDLFSKAGYSNEYPMEDMEYLVISGDSEKVYPQEFIDTINKLFQSGKLSGRIV